MDTLRSGEEIEFRSDNHFKQLLENQLRECKDYLSLCEYQNKRLRKEIKRITKTSDFYDPEEAGIRQKLQIEYNFLFILFIIIVMILLKMLQNMYLMKLIEVILKMRITSYNKQKMNIIHHY